MQFLPTASCNDLYRHHGFDKQHYKFDYVRREFLGEVRCLVFDVSPQDKSGKGRFLGRMWAKIRTTHCRFNGAYGGAGHSSWYFTSTAGAPMCSRAVDAFLIYSEEKDLHYALQETGFKRRRGCGYNVGRSSQEQELSRILVETPVQDDTRHSNTFPHSGTTLLGPPSGR